MNPYALLTLCLMATPAKSSAARGALYWSQTALYWATPTGLARKLAAEIYRGGIGIAGYGSTYPVLSPSFGLAAYVGTDSNLWVVPVGGGPAVKVSRGCSPATSRYSETVALIYGWSADSKKLLFSQIPHRLGGFDAPVDPRPFAPDARNGRFVYDVAAGSVEEVPNFKAFDAVLAPRAVSTSPNGKLSIVARRAGAGPDDPKIEWILKKGRSESVIHTVPNFHAYPSWLDDRFLWYFDRKRELHFFDVTNSMVTIFTPEEPPRIVPASSLWPAAHPPIDEEVATAAAAQERDIQDRLLAIRRALARFYEEHRGRYPTSISELVPGYLPSIPPLDLVQHSKSAEVVEIASNAGQDYKRHLRDSGQWLYISDPKSPMFGTVFVDCSHRPSYGLTWDKR